MSEADLFDQIEDLQTELTAKDAEIARLHGSRFYQVGLVSKSEPDFMSAHLPFPSASDGVTVATLDKAGNLTIKVDQPSEASKPNPLMVDDMLRAIGTGRKIDAIKMYRQWFGATLKDAKDAVDFAMPVKPMRDTPEYIADWILSDLSASEVRARIIKVICAERS